MKPTEIAMFAFASTLTFRSHCHLQSGTVSFCAQVCLRPWSTEMFDSLRVHGL